MKTYLKNNIFFFIVIFICNFCNASQPAASLALSEQASQEKPLIDLLKEARQERDKFREQHDLEIRRWWTRAYCQAEHQGNITSAFEIACQDARVSETITKYLSLGGKITEIKDQMKERSIDIPQSPISACDSMLLYTDE